VLERQNELLDVIQLESGEARRHAFEESLDVALVARYYARSAERLLRTRRRRGALPFVTATWEHHHPVDSGLGRRHGATGILKYTESQTVSIQRLVPIAPPPLVGTWTRLWARAMTWGVAVAESDSRGALTLR
jgi:acyl-CoA reductase-like NAD-dependent aldehyde dehydrogenase